ncbi:MAG: Bax inhibitor-1/YccA family protein [Muribaculaceae bacterium]|nr:Bax inhibitor-1/YccA family protein [Muribaculaceae bacterium]
MNYNNQTPPPYFGGGNGTPAVARTNSVLKKVYVRMFIGLLVTAFVSLGIASNPAIAIAIFSNQLIFWGMLIAMFAMAIMIPVRLAKMSPATTLVMFIVYSALMGAWMSSIFFAYSLGSIAYTFFITAGVFGAMSVYGYLTKSDLSRMGSYLMMGLFGLIIVMVVNLFLQSSQLEWIVSIVGVVLFIGLTAWDTQQIKQLANAPELDGATSDKLATMGAMNLYLDFINLFLFLLRIFGDRN